MSIEQENLLDNIFDQASKCDRCGACLLVCPVLKVNGKEMCSPRGMINASIALKQQSVATKEAVGEVINYCLLCGACVDVCPSKVNIPEVLLKTREYLFNEQALRQPKVIDDHEQLNNAFENLCTLTAQRQNGQAKTIAYFFSYEARRTDINAAAKSVALLSTIADVELVNNDDAGFSAIALGDLAAA
ncbi:MAG TPA: (Fe-S)-binding protein, partial [Candidatus Avacidaminococcus intestinavium]|nr:(Fe-S)-binding protein [Candidatus Avacidaminococcus intestinavium]